MEEKEVFQRLNSLWSIFNPGNLYIYIFRKYNLKLRLSPALSLKKGFTLVELIIVIAIISILAVGSIVALNPVAQFQKANDARRKSDLSQIQKSIETYYQDMGRYPPNSTQCSYEVLGNNGDSNDCIEWGKSWQPYMNVIPSDPTSSNKYVYYVSPDGQAYYLYATLDRGSSDAQACNAGLACNSLSSNGIPTSSCGGTCNFGVSSPNVSP